MNPKLRQHYAVKTGRRSKSDEEKMRLAKAIFNGKLMTTRRRKALSESSEEEEDIDNHVGIHETRTHEREGD